MDVKILPKLLGGSVKAIPSKSQAHRALICAALADKTVNIECDSESKDIAATIACLSALGADIRRKQGGYIVQPLNREYIDSAAVTLPCSESGSTFRFLLPVVCALGRKASFILEGRLSQRPLSPLYEELLRHGCLLSVQGVNPFAAEGKLAPGIYSLDAGVSSQFISGLLFALPLLDKNSELRLCGKIESFPYIELTMSMLDSFNIKIEYKDGVFLIPGGQTYSSAGAIHVEGDWSNAAFWLTAGALGESSVTCTGLDLQSRQGDCAITDILAQFGAQAEKSGGSVTVSGGKLRGIEIDAHDIPDLVPILAAAAAAAEGTTVIRNAERLRGKESDRLAAISSVLNGLGADVRVTEDGLIIKGGSSLTGGKVSSWGDHRIAMAASIASVLCKEPVVIQGAEAVNKSYPGFFDDFRLLGGIVSEIDVNNKLKNIALIGMPGCGKSTVGGCLAQLMSRPLVDIDELIVKTAGKTIPQIFAEDGEEAFRRLETEILGMEAVKSGMIIATGGGVVTRGENLDLLRQNCLIIYLKRELTELVTNDRPLSRSVGIEKLAKQRLPLYEAWSDYVIQAEENPMQTALQILKNLNFSTT
ncbi:MAG: 3-phosphoshikimate 1-carboxyvinyltransferase [Treponema sp.]|jgi:3-phosphoshikimate 1-carboxyvinyltransferase|nr:3-phosphoshikimate 1-carboxyvinyltransferase [Treponema sp.]